MQRNAIFAFIALIGAAPVFAVDCHQYNEGRDFVARLSGTPEGQGLNGCFPTPDALKNELWARLRPLIEKPSETTNVLEVNTVAPGPCKPFPRDANGSPVHRCSYTVTTVSTSKQTGVRTTSTTNSYFGMVMTCGDALNTTWRGDLAMCMRYRDIRPVEMCAAKAPGGIRSTP
ncbi:hypothetical protein ACFJIX_13640 [Roseateles sp. UC29_93]|uniref:hypothetical protein n=1 Tax=Roseateles sp. UC29_93 TaxID=3350177 RepID=UPI00366B7F9A